MRHQGLLKMLVCCLLGVVLSCGSVIAQTAPQTTQPSTTTPGTTQPSTAPRGTTRPATAAPQTTQPSTAPGVRGEPQPGLRNDQASPSAIANFLNSAIELNAAEIELGQLAATKAESERVKMFAQMMVKDHTVGLETLQKLQADASSGTPPLSAHHQELKTRLSSLSGAQFDRAYMDAMVKGHGDAVKMFEREIAASPSRPQSASKPTETDVINAAKELLPTIKKHLDEAQKVQKSLTHEIGGDVV